MMESFQNDAVPLDHQQVHDPSAHQNLPKTTPTLSQPSTPQPEEPSKKLNLEMEAVKLVDPVEEPEQENDQLDSLEEAYHYRENSKDLETAEQPRCDNANTVNIDNTSGVVHFGPTYTFQVKNNYTQVTNQAEQNTQPTPAKEIPSKDFMRPLWYSTKLVEEADLMRLSKNIGKEWKALGNGLKFNWAQLEQFEKDTKSVSEAVHRMLFRWLQWRDQKATVGRLTKVLFNHNEYDAIRCLVDSHGSE